jgi:FlaG/FlaF family flagellin (archaellin)
VHVFLSDSRTFGAYYAVQTMVNSKAVGSFGDSAEYRDQASTNVTKTIRVSISCLLVGKHVVFFDANVQLTNLSTNDDFVYWQGMINVPKTYG